MKINFGGERLYSGNKMDVRLHDYYRSTHNLNKTVRTSMAMGTVVPIWSRVALNGDRFEIDIDSMVMTLPTIGPMLGTAEMDIAVFQWPIRLGIGVLHNNAVKIGMKMSQIKMPSIKLGPLNYVDENGENDGINNTNPSSLCAYLGIRSLGQFQNRPDLKHYREFNALKFMAYWDFYKQYIANKQEDNAKMISSTAKNLLFDNIEMSTTGQIANGASRVALSNVQTMQVQNVTYFVQKTPETGIITKFKDGQYCNLIYKGGYIEDSDKNPIYIITHDVRNNVDVAVRMKNVIEPRTYTETKIQETQGAQSGLHRGTNSPQTDWIWGKMDKGTSGKKSNLVSMTGGVMQLQSMTEVSAYGKIKMNYSAEPVLENCVDKNSSIGIIAFAVPITSTLKYYEDGYDIVDFPLENIDKAREMVLRNCGIGESVTITTDTTGTETNVINFEPYKTNCNYIEIQKPTDIQKIYRRNFEAPMNGLGLACYKSDLFNNWVRSEWIDGENSVGAVSAAQIVDGKLNMDTLNLSQHIYNQLTRVAVCDGTYEGWQEASYGEKALRRAESPIYLGGAKCPIYFEEVVSSANTETSMQGNSPLGTLAGKGGSGKTRGGKIDVKVKEPSILMAVAWITPHIDYSQGNHWEMTELKTMEDLHKPEFDTIGFQDLLTETMFAEVGMQTGNNYVPVAVGKQPAFIQYQTDINECFGDFADPNKAMWMTFNRQYQKQRNAQNSKIWEFKDPTTYINPTLFNQNFADSDLESQNFWVQFAFNIKARRKMSAHIIPNL